MGFSSKGVSSENSSAKIKLGEKVLVTLSKVEVDKDGNLFISVSNKSGMMKHKEFNIDPSDPKYNADWAATEVERIKHVATCFIDEEDIDEIEAADFNGWAQQLALLLEPHYGKTFTCKIVRNKKNWPSFPTFTNFASSEKEERDWGTDASYDFYEYEAEPNAKKDADKDGGSAPEAKSEDDEF